MGDYWTENNLIKPASRVVCAAIRDKVTYDVIIGVRHYDIFMIDQIDKYDQIERSQWRSAEQGFVNQFSEFLTREQAYIIAKENGQIIRPDGTHDDKTLYSECLY